MHIPKGASQTCALLTFDDALNCPQHDDYDAARWLYVPPYYTEYRYILGTRGENPLICIGINPSTAQPGDLDNTLKSVERIALGNGYDSFTMFNVYPQRATDPNAMDTTFNRALHEQNMAAFRYVLGQYAPGNRPAVWAAWGTLIEKRPYLFDALEEMLAIGEEFHAQWLTFGPRSKAGHPHHPLYLRRDSVPEPFDVRAYCAAQRDMQDAAELMTGQTDAELKALCQEELTGAKKRAAALEQELRVLLLPHDPNDEKNVILEIRPGVGGEESALFAHSLFRMYSLYAAARGWTVELLNYNETELGGIKEADFMICGAGAYSRLKFESGVHRVQRVPETESGGRVHTSTATVAVLPEMEQADVDLRPEDIEMQVYRSSGAGGQHINKTSSAVRLIHRPTGIVVACQEERSQFQNRERCMMMLSSKLYQLEQERIESAVSSERRSQVGSGMRNEKIRTYNFPQSRVTDHRIGLTLYQLDSILNGGLDLILDALIAADRAEKLRESMENG